MTLTTSATNYNNNFKLVSHDANFILDHDVKWLYAQKSQNVTVLKVMDNWEKVAYYLEAFLAMLTFFSCTLWEKSCYNSFNDPNNKEALKSKIENLTRKITINTFGKDSNNEKITTFFFEKLSYLNKTLFNHGLFDRGLVDNYVKKLLEIIVKEDTSIKAKENDSTPLTEEQQEVYAQAQKAQAMVYLGNYENGDGCGQTLFIKDWDRDENGKVKKIGVFKNKWGSSLTTASGKRWIDRRKRWCVNFFYETAWRLRARIKNFGEKEYRAELAAHDFVECSNNHFKKSTLKYPKTQVVSIANNYNGRRDIGSYGMWVNGSRQATEKFGLDKAFNVVDTSKPQFPFDSFEQWVAYTYEIGDYDSHAENVLFDEENRCYAIDAGQAFPREHISRSFGYFCVWANHPNAKNKFSKTAKEKIISDIKNWTSLKEIIIKNYSHTYINHQGDRFQEDTEADAKSRASRALERLAVLYILMQKDENIENLRNYRSPKEIYSYILANKDILINSTYMDENSQERRLFSNEQLKEIYAAAGVSFSPPVSLEDHPRVSLKNHTTITSDASETHDYTSIVSQGLSAVASAATGAAALGLFGPTVGAAALCAMPIIAIGSAVSGLISYCTTRQKADQLA